jgi:hypothetical protein
MAARGIGMALDQRDALAHLAILRTKAYAAAALSTARSASARATAFARSPALTCARAGFRR